MFESQIAAATDNNETAIYFLKIFQVDIYEGEFGMLKMGIRANHVESAPWFRSNRDAIIDLCLQWNRESMDEAPKKRAMISDYLKSL